MRHEMVIPALSDGELLATLVRGTAEQSSLLAWWLSVLVEFDRREVWLAEGFHSCRHWLQHRCGASGRTAREYVQVAHALAGAPLTRAAFAEGRLSYSKVRALARVLRADNEDFFLGLAFDLSAFQLNHHIRKWEAAQVERPVDDDALAAKCGVTTWVDIGGLVHHEVVSPSEEGAIINRAIEYGRDQCYKERRAADKATREAGGEVPVRLPRTPAQRNFEGLSWVCKRGLVNAERDPTPVDDPFLIVLHVREGSASINEAGRVEFDNGISMSPATLERLCCSSMVQAMLTSDGGDVGSGGATGGEGGEGRPLDLGRRVRVATPKQKTALSALFDSCAFPGCDAPLRWCQFHHVAQWERDHGRSDLDNFRPLCKRHHALVHTGWELVLDPGGGVVAISPTGRRHGPGVEPLTDTPISIDDVGDRFVALGFDPDDPERADQINGRFGGETMTPWASAEIGYQICLAMERSERAAGGGERGEPAAAA